MVNGSVYLLDYEDVQVSLTEPISGLLDKATFSPGR